MPGQDTKSTMLDAALAWADKGFAVFPCVPLGKEPAGGNGHKDATTDRAVITAWWTENPNANIGVSPGHSGMFVLDVDPPRGEETLADLELQHGLLPATLSFRSPRGGRHLWYRGRCPTSVGTEKNGKVVGLGAKLDTRGYGGYVLLPPSRVVDRDKGIDGNYQCTDDREIADGPGWIAEVIARNKEHHAAADVDLDLLANIERATTLLNRYIRDGDVAVEGAGGDDRTYRLACEVLNLGISPARAFELIGRIWLPHCEFGFTLDEAKQWLAAKVRNAAEYSQNDMGAWAVASGTETFGHLAGSLGSDEAGSEGLARSRYFPYPITDIEAFAPPEWLIPDLIPKGGTVQITGKQKSFKTFLALDLALGVAAGELTFNHVPVAAPAVYIAGENASAIALKHVPAWCLSRKQEAALLPFYIVQSMPHAAFPEEIDEMIREIKKQEIAPAIVVIDTATRALRGLDENSAKDMGQFSAACEHIQRELHCTVVVIRHTGKDESRGGRGSNVIDGDFDTILDVERHEKSLFVQLRVREQRNAAERETPYTFEMHQCGPSLIVEAVNASEFARATKKEDPFAPSRIGAVLAALQVYGEDAGVSTYVVASELCPPIAGETAEERERILKRAEKQLRNRAHTILSGYVAGEGSGIKWFLPAESRSDRSPQAAIDPADQV